MTTKIQRMHPLCLAALLLLGGNTLAGQRFTLNGQVLEVLPSTGVSSKAASATGDSFISVKEMATGQVKLYASGLIITLKQASALKALLNDYPALHLEYAPGAVAYVQLPNSALAATFDALSADARVAAVHLRPMPVPVKPR
ncbi:MAG: hypothetical protein FD135_2082 [Comamonadaceae bacterium]|nr:MAG: hypothetical protein FD135_2082 [Comamonadaceae bacterium]